MTQITTQPQTQAQAHQPPTQAHARSVSPYLRQPPTRPEPTLKPSTQLNADILWPISPSALAAAHPQLALQLHQLAAANTTNLTPALRWRITTTRRNNPPTSMLTATQFQSTAQPQLILLNLNNPQNLPQPAATLDLDTPQSLTGISIHRNHHRTQISAAISHRLTATFLLDPSTNQPKALAYASTPVLQTTLNLPGGTYEQPILDINHAPTHHPTTKQP